MVVEIMRRKIIIVAIMLGLAGFIYLGEEDTAPLAKESMQMVHREATSRILSNQLTTRFWRLTDIDLEANSVMLIEAETGFVIYQSNSDISLPAASMSKLMSELIILEKIEAGELDWDTEVLISDYAYYISHHPGYASAHLDQDRSYTVRELFQSMAISSANGATIALAEIASGSEDLFVRQMNQRAVELGLNASTFVNSTGLDNEHLGQFFSVGTIDDTNKMSAQDLTTLARHLINHHPTLLEITSQPQYVANDREYLNTNLMLTDFVPYQGVDGLKTGYTGQAGYGFTGTVKQGDIRLISVVMGTESIIQRFIETKKLYEQAFELLNKLQ